MNKLKELIESIKGVLMYILAPITFIGGIIYYLITKNTSLENQLNQSKAEAELAKTLEEKGMLDEKADNSTKSLNELSSEFQSKYGNGDDSSADT